MPATIAARPSRPTVGARPHPTGTHLGGAEMGAHPTPRPTATAAVLRLQEAARSGARLGYVHDHDPFRLAAHLGLKTSVIEPWNVRYARGRPLARGEQVAAFLSDVDARTPTVFLVQGRAFGPVGYPLAWAIGAWLNAGTPTFDDDDALSLFAMTFLGLRRA